MNDTRLSLDGAWDFQIDPADGADVSAIQHWRTAQVPRPWQAQFDDLRHFSGTAWYRRHFTVPPATASAKTAAILHFGAVDYLATVWLNGHAIGEHEGGYLPFEFDVAPYLHAGENELVVRVVDASDDRNRFPDYPFSEVPHGKQSWYGPIGGIWQSVWLEFRPTVHIVSMRLTPTPATATIEIDVTLSAPLAEQTRLVATVFDPAGSTVASATLDGNGYGQARLAAPPALWSPETPNLYTVETRLEEGGTTQHAVRNICGFRTVEARAGRIYLNGEPIYLRGVLDQAYYPETIYTPPSEEFLEDQARKAKALGLNCLRTHIKIEDPRYYEVADRLGLLVWTEIPNWALLTPAADSRAKETFRGMVARDWNHPSIIAWTLINENWGTDLVRNPEHRRWLADFYHEARQIDPTRLIVDNSACCDNFHVASDLEDFHHYRAIPDHAQEWDEWVADFAGRQNDWVWAADYGQERRPELPLIVSEFGNWGLPHPDAIREGGRDPWWFDTGYEREFGIVHPRGMRERFAFYGLDKVFGSLDEFILAVQEHMARSLHYEIATMRLQPAIAGYVITEFTDVHWECNGLLTMQRQIKHGLEPLFTEINQDRVVVVRPRQWSGHPGNVVEVDIDAFDVAGPGAGGTIAWQAGATSGRLPAPGGTAQIPLTTPGHVAVHVQWSADDGHVLAKGRVELTCVDHATPGPAVCVIDDAALAASLRSLDYTVSEGLANLATAMAQGAIVISNRYTQALQDALQAGAKVLLVASPELAAAADTVPLPAGRVIARAGTPWQGDWATAFSWLKKQKPFAALPGGPLLGLEYAPIMPDAILTGLPAWAYSIRSWAGLALGWIHMPVSLLAELHYGRGRLVVTTFKLNAENLSNIAVAQTLLAGILQLLER
ncbi:MAG: beta galactosidase jelly roll domain-containing protein [Caldilineaceae bacterium]|nr:beta galactosidase jelly roll domain-containing protein [Caldilineaceae bacterium]